MDGACLHVFPWLEKSLPLLDCREKMLSVRSLELQAVANRVVEASENLGMKGNTEETENNTWKGAQGF